MPFLFKPAVSRTLTFLIQGPSDSNWLAVHRFMASSLQRQRSVVHDIHMHAIDFNPLTPRLLVIKCEWAARDCTMAEPLTRVRSSLRSFGKRPGKHQPHAEHRLSLHVYRKY